MQDALTRARLSGRNHIVANDVSATFESLNIPKVYGAQAAPNWKQLDDPELYYIEVRQMSIKYDTNYCLIDFRIKLSI